MSFRLTSLPPARRAVLMGMGAGVVLTSLPAFASNLTGVIAPYKLADLSAGEIGAVGRIIDGDSLMLESGLAVKLAAIEAPQAALRSQNRAAWPFASEAKAGLSAIIGGRDVQLFDGGETRDRYKRATAQLYPLTPDGKPDFWVQEELVRLGLARVYTRAGQSVDSARLYAAERAAREAGRGIWSHEFYAVRNPDPNTLAQFVDSSQIVEGIILSAADVRGRIYLNFGVDYKTDFTITIAKKNVKSFAQAGVDLLALEGARVRVRGWIELINGPSIWANHPTQIEILGSE